MVFLTRSALEFAPIVLQNRSIHHVTSQNQKWQASNDDHDQASSKIWIIIGCLKACILASKDKMKVDVKSDPMDMALRALVQGLYQNPLFQKQGFLAVE
jgi:hypothetical protein